MVPTAFAAKQPRKKRVIETEESEDEMSDGKQEVVDKEPVIKLKNHKSAKHREVLDADAESMAEEQQKKMIARTKNVIPNPTSTEKNYMSITIVRTDVFIHALEPLKDIFTRLVLIFDENGIRCSDSTGGMLLVNFKFDAKNAAFDSEDFICTRPYMKTVDTSLLYSLCKGAKKNSTISFFAEGDDPAFMQITIRGVELVQHVMKFCDIKEQEEQAVPHQIYPCSLTIKAGYLADKIKEALQYNKAGGVSNDEIFCLEKDNNGLSIKVTAASFSDSKITILENQAKEAGHEMQVTQRKDDFKFSDYYSLKQWMYILKMRNTTEYCDIYFPYKNPDEQEKDPESEDELSSTLCINFDIPSLGICKFFVSSMVPDDE